VPPRSGIRGEAANKWHSQRQILELILAERASPLDVRAWLPKGHKHVEVDRASVYRMLDSLEEKV
jgi:Fe2+ or Zn2+ uptake regulation protein